MLLDGMDSTITEFLNAQKRGTQKTYKSLLKLKSMRVKNINGYIRHGMKIDSKNNFPSSQNSCEKRHSGESRVWI